MNEPKTAHTIRRVLVKNYCTAIDELRTLVAAISLPLQTTQPLNQQDRHTISSLVAAASKALGMHAAASALDPYTQ